jgi:hypothetical protein
MVLIVIGFAKVAAELLNLLHSAGLKPGRYKKFSLMQSQKEWNGGREQV